MRNMRMTRACALCKKERWGLLRVRVYIINRDTSAVALILSTIAIECEMCTRILPLLFYITLTRTVHAQGPNSACPTGGVDGFLCYSSTDCRGGVVDGDGSLSSAADCCGGIGLSYCITRGCQNCFSECKNNHRYIVYEIMSVSADGGDEILWCLYCGLQCNVNLHVLDNENQGHICKLQLISRQMYALQN